MQLGIFDRRPDGSESKKRDDRVPEVVFLGHGGWLGTECTDRTSIPVGSKPFTPVHFPLSCLRDIHSRHLITIDETRCAGR